MANISFDERWNEILRSKMSATINVTHWELISEIEKEMHLSKISMSSKPMRLLDDFIINIKKLSKLMDTTNTNFYLKNRDQINRLYSAVKEYRDWLQSIFTDKTFIRSLGDFTLVHNDWIDSKHRFAMYRVLEDKNGELVITVFYEWLWNSSPDKARLYLYLQPIGSWFEKAIVNEITIRSIAAANGVPSMDRHKDFWHCPSVTIPVPESHLQNEEEFKKYLIKHIGNPDSGLMITAREIGELLSEMHIPSYQWKDAADKLQKIITRHEDIDPKFIISQIDFKLFDPTTQIVVLEVVDDFIRYKIERYLDKDLLRAIRYAYGNEARYSILCRQLCISI